ncbi:MAG TPA: DUF1707 domain-containing protein [Dactylosporangium sp.]|uniref:DUF1707 domain-containing protein n=1 Tax=Dactylosporangium darangshiense TaxID=579108 RepID=A0ABP8D6H5_9ACTN|nr:DUF1707 domain-containing protein [Dactylosporangium sp.]
MRASDEDRKRVIGVLQRHTEAGRLTLDEFSDRVGTVYAAKTLDDLRAAVVDLPALSPSPSTPPPSEPHDGRALLLTFALAIVAVALIGTAYTLFH